MRLPDFLVIGAMKAGTTSLCRDLESQPGIFFPTVKEPHTLVFDDVLTEAGKRKYATLFKDARAEQKCGEGSTGYSKIPLHKNVPQRARAVVGDKLKVIYSVRDPVERAISHHYHMFRAGDAPLDFGQALGAIPLITLCSRYAFQIEPWIQEIGSENIRINKFEDFVSDRDRTVSELVTFLDVHHVEDMVDHEETDHSQHNVGEDQLLPPPTLRNLVRKITRSQFYKRNIHPRTPAWVRNGFKSAVYQKAQERPPLPDEDTLAGLVEALQPDVHRLSELFGLKEPLWNLEDTFNRYINPANQVRR